MSMSISQGITDSFFKNALTGHVLSPVSLKLHDRRADTLYAVTKRYLPDNGRYDHVSHRRCRQRLVVIRHHTALVKLHVFSTISSHSSKIFFDYLTLDQSSQHHCCKKKF